MSSIQKDYRTADLYLAAFLKASKLAFLDIQKVSGRVYFIFEFREDIKSLKNSYFARTALVSPLDFADELRALKTLCHM